MKDAKDMAAETAERIVSSLNFAANKAMLICFALKFLIGVSVYVILQHAVNQAIAELWMLGIFGWTMFKHELLVSAFIKAEMLNKIAEDSKEENEENEEEKDNKLEQEDPV